MLSYKLIVNSRFYCWNWEII